jgi:small subunit ribosomal protein S9
MKKETLKYFEGVGRRKTSTARVRITPSADGFSVNDSDYKSYFKTEGQRLSAAKPLSKVALPEKVGVSVKVGGGGLASQADAISLGLARAIVKMDSTLRPALRTNGLMTRDPRAVERKKYGLKKARRAPQWAKR